MNAHSFIIKTCLVMSSTKFKHVLIDFYINYRTLMFRPDKSVERMKAVLGLDMK